MNHDILDLRGSSYARRRRREWLLSPEAGFGGTGKSVPCYHCQRRVTYVTMQVDRFPLCGHDGGRYTRDNVVPSCGACNHTRCEGCRGFRAARYGLLDREKLKPWEEEEIYG